MRYIVLLAGVIAAVVAILGVARGTRAGQTPAQGGRVAGRLFVVALDIQVLLGVGVLLTRPFYPALMGHLTMMVLAAVAAHAIVVMLKRRPPERRSPWLQLAGVVVPLVLIVGGILAIGRPVF
ncbi:MAG: hypothetical protein ACREMQ_06180, partial [Longimicrobiales bacterium]